MYVCNGYTLTSIHTNCVTNSQNLLIMKMYGYTLPWNRAILTARDKKVLKAFFSEGLRYIERPLSTNEIAEKLNEGGKRSKLRLNKLKEFDLLKVTTIHRGKRYDHYWHITEEGILCVLTMFRQNKIREFIRANSQLSLLSNMEMSLSKNDWNEIMLMIKEIRDCVNTCNYRKISRVIKDWYIDGNVPVRLPL